MHEIIRVYIKRVESEFATGRATEHSYRPFLKDLLEGVDPHINAINEPKRQACGAPDFIVQKKEIPVGFIEAKDIGVALDDVEVGEQMMRYRDSLDNLILTDYLEFRFFLNGERVSSVSLISIDASGFHIDEDEVDRLSNLLKDFLSYQGQTIKSASRLAKTMAAKARLMKDVIVKSLQDEDRGGELRSELDAFRQVLIHDMTEEDFADMYAQTIAYGLFAARLHDTTLNTFSRQEAAGLLPKTNPFLRKLFNTIAGPDLDTRVVWIVDALADVFRATDIKKILSSFTVESKRQDPFIHFYETFLSEYNPKLRKSRGVWYTPEPVVKFIVRAIDDILKKDFSLAKGLADTSMTTVEVDAQMADGRYKDGKRTFEKQVHRVQILDPATGTGTFLAEVVRTIHAHFEGQAGIWESYVNEHLLPRIHGFEILMASYAMCHLKLDLLLTELGYKPKDNSSERLSVYLTNSLEEAHPDTNTLFSSWLSNEANEANRVKKETPVMVVLGNPPYSGESSNKGDFIMSLMEVYKKEPGGKEKLKERNPKWINDDYVKFIRFSEYMIEKNSEGVLGFITNHGYLDNPTFRGMRWHLLKTFDKIYILDLHGNSKRKEVAPDGSKDENVFDIQQGVSIILAVRNGSRGDQLAEVHHADFYGKRQKKYDELMENNVLSIDWAVLKNQEPNYPFVERDFEAMEKYKEGFVLNELFPVNSVGIVTSRDSLVIDKNKQQLEERMQDFISLEPSDAKSKYNLRENKHWKIQQAQSHNYDSSNIKTLSYRPFDDRFVYYHTCFIERAREKVMRHMLAGENLGLMICRQLSGKSWYHVSIVNGLVDDSYVSNKSRERGYVNPLYLYPDSDEQSELLNVESRKPNLDKDMVARIAEVTGLRFVPDHATPEAQQEGVFTPMDVLDYVYAVLHSPTYRETYKEFLKIDFPRVPFPQSRESFERMARLGGELRAWHLMEHKDSDTLITTFPESGSNVVESGYPKFEDGRVHINKDQYFDGVSETAWNFYIGGYQPAQKWLKDRRDRALTFDDILHWQKVIVALVSTDRVMGEVDGV